MKRLDDRTVELSGSEAKISLYHELALNDGFNLSDALDEVLEQLSIDRDELDPAFIEWLVS